MPSPEPTPQRLRPEHAPDRRQVLVDSAPPLSDGAATPRLEIRPTRAPRDLAYATALVAACERMWVATDVAILWRTIVDEAMALIPANGAVLITYTERFWQALAARPGDAAPDDSAAAATEMLFQRGLLRHPISIDDLAEGTWGVGQGWRALLVVRIQDSPRQPVLLVWYATRPASLSSYADIAEAFAHHASLGPESRFRARKLESSGGRATSRRAGTGNLDDSPSAHSRPGVRSAATRVAEQPCEAKNDRSNGRPDWRSAGLRARGRLTFLPGYGPSSPEDCRFAPLSSCTSTGCVHQSRKEVPL